MISIQKKFLFIHVPKTGGNSIQNILRDYSEDEIVVLSKHQDGIERFEVRNSKFNITKHSTLSHYKSVLDSNTFCSLYKFATIRNPWDMMISYYFSPHRRVSDWNRNDFITLVSRVPTLRHYVCEKSVLEKMFAKFAIKTDIGRRKVGQDIDFLIRFERLSEDFKIVCEKLGIPSSPLPKRNSSTRSHYSKYYDEELKEIVRKKFREEIEIGKYTFKNS